MIPVYPETLLLPLPKGLSLLGKVGERLDASFIESTGGMKQWFRLGRSYSVEGGFKMYGLRWGQPEICEKNRQRNSAAIESGF